MHCMQNYPPLLVRAANDLDYRPLRDGLLQIYRGTGIVGHRADENLAAILHEARLVPVEVFIGRRHEQDVRAHGIGAVFVHHVDGRHHVAL